MASTSSASSHSASRPTSPDGLPSYLDSVPVETLVKHLLNAKRSLSSMRLVLRANELVHAARQAHEESVILSAQTQFLRRGITEQMRLLLRVRKGLTRAYDDAKREFKQIIKTLDLANGRLEDTMNILRGRVVNSAFRPPDEEKRNLLDFVDEAQVDRMREALKENIQALQTTQQSFDQDLLQFESDLRNLKAIISSSPSPTSPSVSSSSPPILNLLSTMIENSHVMAELLTSLTRHFDLCVTAVRTTEGGPALARIKAAEATQSQEGDDVSISGVISDQESHMPDLKPLSPEDRAQMLEVLEQDSSEVEDVVQELNERLHSVEADFNSLDQQTAQVKLSYLSTLDAFRTLEDIGTRIQSYMSAEVEFRDRWVEEQGTIRDKMSEMEELRTFYEKYANTYDHLIIEVERRRGVEEKVLGIWRRAKDSVEKIIDGDRRARDLFRQEVADHLPTDLWPAMDDPILTWDVVPSTDKRLDNQGAPGTPILEKGTIEGAKKRHRLMDSK
ncbi:putative kinase activator [Rosellinia necatrix]|uniref:Autophagy-related protein 17 n=1 Tax=Rosellinia necatrix TaxID=77044 RepID=A0A1W2THS5_ROSNE|nr:putative kinase activator [Rosellinia necatrix]